MTDLVGIGRRVGLIGHRDLGLLVATGHGDQADGDEGEHGGDEELTHGFLLLFGSFYCHFFDKEPYLKPQSIFMDSDEEEKDLGGGRSSISSTCRTDAWLGCLSPFRCLGITGVVPTLCTGYYAAPGRYTTKPPGLKL
jgi:hypothetical protein